MTGRLKSAAKRFGPAVVVAAIVAAACLSIAGQPARAYLTINPSVAQRFVAVPSEASVIDLCYRLQGIQGVTGVGYRDYSPENSSATVIVFYNPRETSVRQLKIFMLHTNLLWQKEKNV